MKILKLAAVTTLACTLFFSSKVSAIEWGEFTPTNIVTIDNSRVNAAVYKGLNYVSINNIPYIEKKGDGYYLTCGEKVFTFNYKDETYVPLKALKNYYNINMLSNQIDLTKKGDFNYVGFKMDNTGITNNLNTAISLTCKEITYENGKLYTRYETYPVGSGQLCYYKNYANVLARAPMKVFDSTGKMLGFNTDALTYLDMDTAQLYIDNLNTTYEELFPHFYTEYTDYKGRIVKLVNLNGSIATILYDDGTKTQVSKNTLTLRTNNRINTKQATKAQIESFIRMQNYKTVTTYIVFVDLNRQKVYVLQTDGTKWNLIKTLTCSSGKNTTPTPKGEYKLTKYVKSFGQEHGYCCKYAVGFIGGEYLFHSILFNKAGTKLLEGRGVLGQQASDGCIRFSPENAKWFYDTLPLSTKVIIW